MEANHFMNNINQSMKNMTVQTCNTDQVASLFIKVVGKMLIKNLLNCISLPCKHPTVVCGQDRCQTMLSYHDLLYYSMTEILIKSAFLITAN